jgi:hypothetical protein
MRRSGVILEALIEEVDNIHMALRDAMRASATQFLAPGETIQEVFSGQTGSPLVGTIGVAFGLIGALIAASFNQYRIVTVTDQRILILDAGTWSRKNARAVIDVLPRATMLGPCTGISWHTIETPSGKIRVHSRSFKYVEAADHMIAPVPN